MLDQLYVSEAETTLSAGPVETRDGPSTASRLVQDRGAWGEPGSLFLLVLWSKAGTEP